VLSAHEGSSAAMWERARLALQPAARQQKSDFGFEGNFKNYDFMKTRISAKRGTSRGQAAGAVYFIRAAKYL
jgi:hypothetical protein